MSTQPQSAPRPEHIVQTLTAKQILLQINHGKLSVKAAKGKLTPDLVALIRDNKPALLSYLQSLQQSREAKNTLSIPMLDRTIDNPLPLSFSQQRLWFIDQYQKGNSANYNMPVALVATGHFSPQIAQKALASIIERHEVLRSVYANDSQWVRPFAELDIKLPVTDLSELSEAEQTAEMTRIAQQDAIRPFDLSDDLMLRASYLRQHAGRGWLLFNMHHIASDGWSMGIMVQEFSALYKAYSQGLANPLPPLPIQYADYAHWQRHWLQNQVLDQQLGYWQKQLTGLPLVHGLPLDNQRPVMQSFAGAVYHSQIDVQASHKLSQYCQSQGASLFMGLYSVFAVLLGRYSNDNDIVIGSPVANRDQAEVTGLMGFFVNTLVLRCDLSTDPSFVTLLAQSKQLLLDAYAHQQVPFEQIVEQLQPQRSLSFSPLFQVMLALQTQSKSESHLSLGDLTLTPVEKTTTIATYDLTLNISEGESGLQLEWEYNTDLFYAATIKQLAGHFEQLLNALMATPEQSVLAVPMLNAQQQHQLLVEYNDTKVAYRQDLCIHHLFEQQAETHPDAIAVVFADQQLTYAELNQRSHQLAVYLVERKAVKTQTLVGICVERSIDMLVGILAILKAGGAYVPLDPAYPKARLEYIIGDAAITTVLTQSWLRGQTPVSDEQALFLDDMSLDDTSWLDKSQSDSSLPQTHAHQLAYLIHTSGSTGKPKGVMIEHRNVVALLSWGLNTFDQHQLSAVCASTSMCFDLSVFEFFAPLAAGGTVYIVDNLLTLAQQPFVADLTLINTVPSTAPMVMAAHAQLTSLQTVVFCGEPLKQQVVDELYHLGVGRVYDLYGPSEDTVYSTQALRQLNGRHTIGKPIDNTQVYVLNPAKQLVPNGVAGELHIGGDGLSRGYLNRADLTDAQFIASPFNSNKRLYKTGDLVRWQDGQLVYLSRIDNQVKVRGFRIELGEIEHQLMAINTVNNAVVQALDDSLGDKYLAAYVVTDDECSAHLTTKLTLSLPDYMVPSVFVFLPELPLTPNGKVDRKALPAPDMAQQQASFVPPSTDTEKTLSELWQQVLNVEQVGITDNFFALGGHSLSATRLMAQVNRQFKVNVPLETLFTCQTIQTFAPQLQTLNSQDYLPLEPIGREGELVTSFAQQRLWLLDQIDGPGDHYNMPGALKLSGELSLIAMNKAFSSIVERHESLRTVFAKGADGQPIQCIRPAQLLTIEVTDLSALSQSRQSQQQTQLAELINQHGAYQFDLTADLMLQLALVKLEEREYVLLLNMHHIASDGWSMGVLIDEFKTLYGAYVQGQANPLQPLTIQYADYAYWQRSTLQGEVLARQLDYWTEQLTDLPLVHQLPLDKPRPPVASFNGATHATRLNNEITGQLNQLCQSAGATLFMGLQAAFSVLLARYSNQTDIVIGSPVANREQADIAGLIGFFVNTLVLRSDLSSNPSFEQLLVQSRQMLLDAYSHQQLPFEQLVEHLQPERRLSHSPFFQVMLVLQNYQQNHQQNHQHDNQQTSLTLPNLQLTPLAQVSTLAKFDLTLTVVPSGEDLLLDWEYNTDLFDIVTIEQMAKHFEQLLVAMLKAPEQNVLGIDMLSHAEHQQRLLYNDTATDDRSEQSVCQYFEQQVQKTPNATALMCGDESLTYAELNHQASCLAQTIVSKGCRQVGIGLGRSTALLVAVLGVMKSGASYVAISPDLPPERRDYLLSDAAVDLLLLAADFDDMSMDKPLTESVAHNADSIVYILYTSGSTGLPKGVAIRQQGLSNYVTYAARHYFTDISDSVVSSPLGFDATITTLLTPLMVGGCVDILPENNEILSALATKLASSSPKIFKLTPAHLAGVLDIVTSTIQTAHVLVVGGDQFLRPLLRRCQALLPNGTFINEYGPTETVVGCSTYTIAPGDTLQGEGAVPIGRAIENTQLYVVGKGGQQQPGQSVGELWIGGDGVAAGYWQRDKQTATCFITNPFVADPQARVYKSGDLVRFLPDGALEYLGRIDNQINIRGFRIEPGEISHRLTAIEGIDEALVLAKNNSAGDKVLVAYMVISPDINALNSPAAVSLSKVKSILTTESQSDKNAPLEYTEKKKGLRVLGVEDNDKIRQQLAEHLPEYMLPTAFVCLNQWPLTANGKVDTKALPDPIQQPLSLVPPTNPLEKTLCDIWQTVLGLEQVGITDNFFALGGHSLSATRVVAAIAQQLALNVPLKWLFSHQTIVTLAPQLAGLKQGLDRPPLTVVSRDNTLISSFAQQRLWLLDRIDGSSVHYNIPAALNLSGKLNITALNHAFTDIIERHESLRTVFVAGSHGLPEQVIHQAVPVTLVAIEGADHQALQQAHDAYAFDLSSDVMLQVKLLKLGETEHRLLLNMHHIASDGWSVDILVHELCALYDAYAKNQANPLKPLPIQYADYAHWQRHWLKGDVLEQQLDYWRTQLNNLPVAHSLLLDKPRPAIQTFNGATLYRQLNSGVTQSLTQLCQSAGATLFMGLHAAFSVLLARYSNQNDIVMGSPVANREQAEIAGLIGFFVNTLVLRSDLSANPDFATLLQQSKNTLLDAYAHQQVPFEQLVETLKPQRSTSHHPLFQVVLVLQNNAADALTDTLAVDGLQITPLEPTAVVAKYDLTLTVSESDQGLLLGWAYNTDLFNDSTIKRMAGHFMQLVASLVSAPQQSVFCAPMLGEQAQQQLLAFNRSAVAHPTPLCIHQMFEQQAAQRPDAIALIFDGQSLSYDQLNTRANQLAAYLMVHTQVGPDTLVGVCIERSLDLVMAILAILKTGSAYVPLDPEAPQSRLDYMLADAKPETVLSQRHLAEKLPQALYIEELALDNDSNTNNSNTNPSTNPIIEGLTPANLAYVIYTSGTTGQPKGVLQNHQNLLQLMASTRVDYQFDHTDRWVLFHACTFDFSVWELWGALYYGGSLLIPDKATTRDSLALATLCKQQQVSVLNQTPGAFYAFTEAVLANNINLPALRYVIFGGDKLNLAKLAPWWQRFGDQQPVLVNMYGITETTVHTTFKRLSQTDNPVSSTIGKGLAGQKLYVLNSQMQPVPVGAPGALYVGGEGLALGYLNQPELTAIRFAEQSVMGDTLRLYDTGDLVYWQYNGELAYLGRIDTQVKIRGFRIELGEIEHALTAHPAITDAVVLAKGGDTLVAYIVAGQKIDDLRSLLSPFLSQSLPEYMLPSAYVTLAQLPLTVNGKIDTKALPDVDMSQQQAQYVAPVSEIEKTLCDIWQQVLSLKKIGVTDNFFALGGHSLSATRVIAQINQQLGLVVPLKSLFSHQTIHAFALHLTGFEQAALTITPASRDGELVTSFAQQRLWLLDQIDGPGTHYNIPTALQLTGPLDLVALNAAVNTIIERHESLRTVIVKGSKGQPVQQVNPLKPLNITVMQTSDLTAAIQQHAAFSFDLASDQMLQVALIESGVDEHVLLLNMHHIASDGWSMGLLVNEFGRLYTAYAHGLDNPLAPLALQYADYALWQRSDQQADVLAEQLDYWTGQLDNLPPSHSLPLDKPRPAIQTYNGATVYRQPNSQMVAQLHRLCQSSGVTVFMALQAAFSVLLARYHNKNGNQTDIVMGSPVANREQAEVADLIGFFVNTLVLRSDLSGNPDFIELLGRSKQMLLEAYAHQQLPFEQLVEQLQPERSLSHSPLFQILLVMQNNPQGVADLPGLAVSAIEAQQPLAKYDLTLSISEDLQLSWNYNTDLFEHTTIERMAGHFERLLEALVSTPQQSVFAGSMLDNLEQQQLFDFNPAAVDYAKDRCVHQLFEQQVERTPQAIAVVFGSQQLSYDELNRRANQLGHYLQQQRQIGVGSLVGLCVERSIEMMVALLAILKTGGAYVPLNPALPQDRLAYMIEDAGLSVVLNQNDLNKSFDYASTNLANTGQHLNNLAYVIYTSGTTGQPKGVEIEHGAMLDYCLYGQRRYYADALEASLIFTSFAFDMTVPSLYLPLLCGDRVELVSPEDELMALSQRLVNSESHYLLRMTPMHINALLLLLPDGFVGQAEHVFVVGGEAFQAESARDLQRRFPASQLFNHYGPTEATVGCSLFDVTAHLADASGVLPIGQPMDNTQLYVLDDRQQLLPIGASGELYIGGACLARGYLGQPELTADKFVANPFNDDCKRLYRSGDLVRRQTDGTLDYLGRVDHQLKIRGFRIEPGEIEAQLKRHALVNDALVLAKGEQADKTLVAYVVTDHDEPLHPQLTKQLRQQLESGLPDYMVPSFYVLLPALPLTVNGKVDRRALPEPDISQQQAVYIAPASVTEKLLADLWQQLLGIESVGANDNFFALGGHSLLVVQLTSQAQIKGLSVSARQVFATKTLAQLASAVDADGQIAAYQAPANLIAEGCQNITPDMLPLVALTAQQIALIEQDNGGNIQDIYPLGPLQQGILFSHMISDDNDPYILNLLLRVKGQAALDHLTQSLQLLVNRHDVLRTGVIWQGLPEAVQVVYRQAQLSVNRLASGNEDAIVAAMLGDPLSMDLSQAPLLVVNVAAVVDGDNSDDRYMVQLNLHHIVSDHVGLEVIQKELALLDAGLFEQLPPPVPYREFVAHTLHQAANHHAETFFTELLGDIDEPTAPFGLLNVTGDGRNIVGLRAEVPSDIGEAVYRLAKSLQLSPAVLFHAAWAMVIGACSGRNDVVFGSVMSGRLQGTSGAEDMMGMFINTSPVRVKLASLTAISLVNQMRDTLHDLLPYEQASLAMAQQCSGLANDMPLFSALFNYRHSTAPEVDAATVELISSVEFVEVQERTNYPLNLSVDSYGNGFALDLQLDSSVKPEQIMGYMQTALASLVDSLSNTPEQPLSTLAILPQVERQRLLTDWNDTAVAHPQGLCVHQLFEQQVELQPDAVAVIFAGQSLSYAQLNARANQLAHYLLDTQLLQPDTLVAICIERSLEMLIAMLAVLKAGGAYLPLDPAYPQQRLDYMLADAQINTVLTQNSPQPAELEQYPTSNITLAELELTPNHLAYVIYTSGSTGQPKGVLVEHHALVTRLYAFAAAFKLGRGHIVASIASFAFDISLLELIYPLTCGAGVRLLSSAQVKNVTELSQAIQQCSFVHMVPSLAQVWLDEVKRLGNAADYVGLQTVATGGDAVPASLLTGLKQTLGDIAVWQFYGPTEAVLFAVSQPQAADCPTALGSALDNVSLYVLDDQLNVQPQGAAGELYIGGSALARGYLNQPVLTQAAFIEDPFTTDARLYKTGDLVRWQAEGQLAYLGRVDHQVKIRGFRIELGEIEHQLTQHSAVSEAVVLAKGGIKGIDDKRLVAYIVSDESCENIDNLRQYLAERLPEHMLPSVFVSLDTLPLTANGKIDRRALPEPDMAQQQVAYMPPKTDAENTLCQIWQAVLGLEQVGISDNFFALGGHSLSATRVMAQVNQQFGFTVPLKLLFSHPTIMAFAPQLAGLQRESNCPPLIASDGAMVTSFAQQRLWLLDQIDGGGVQYNMPSAIKLSGELNMAALNAALTTIVERHESVRTVFATDQQGEPLQVVQAAMPMVVPVLTTDLATALEQQASYVFDLSSDLMLQMALVKVADDKHVLLFNMHHIASDGWSMGLLINEFSTLYRAYVQGEDNPLSPLPLQYADYARWQRKWLQGEVLEQQLFYWRTQLKDLPQVHTLPLDRPRPAQRSFNGALVHSQIDSHTTKRLNLLCQNGGATLFMGLQGAFSVLLSRYSNQNDMVIGSPVANREQAQIAGLIGFFVNTLVLRSDLSGNPGFADLLEQSRLMLLDAYAHQQVPFEQLVEQLQPERSLSHSPLFQVMLVLQNNPDSALELPGLTLNPVERVSSMAKYDLTLTVSESEQGLQLSWGYNTDLFDAARIEQMALNFDHLLVAMLNKPQQGVFSLPMGDAVEFNAVVADYPQDGLLHQLFEQQVAQNPDAIAVMFDGGQLSYVDLNARANQLAGYLSTQRQVTAETLVGVCVERSPQMLVAMLGILKAGGAFVPLDPDAPAVRLAFSVKDAGLTTVLTQRHLLERLPLDNAQAVCLDDMPTCAAGHDVDLSSVNIPSSNLAYVIYTSGTTGVPKGVMIEHRQLVMHLSRQRQHLQINADEVFVLLANPVFDAAIEQLLLPLISGARVVLPTTDTIKQPEQLKAMLVEHQVTHLHATPAYLAVLDGLPAGHAIRRVMSGGDVMSDSLRQRFGDLLINRYGPTETTITCCQHLHCVADEPLNTIGKPLANTTAYVLNKALQPVPPGVVGELYIGGAGVARGYLNLPELTNERFITSPFTVGDRLYKSGDLVKWQANGQLEFVGRIDHQVKIRGFRIELGDIEAQLKSLVDDAVVLAKGEGYDRYLVAYIVSTTQTDILPQQLAETLPDYMVPTVFIPIDKLPLTTNGKVDRNALPEPDRAQQQAVYRPPTTNVEKALCQIWQGVLGLEQVGITDNFFALGGHSLSATRVAAQIRQQLDITVGLKPLFACQTIAELAALFSAPFTTPLGELKRGSNYPPLVAIAREGELVTSFAQRRLWLLDQIDGPSSHYNMPVALRLSGRLDIAALNGALTTIVERHESLRTVFVNGSHGEPVQVINPPMPVEVVDMSADADAVERHAGYVFDLARDLMLQVALVTVAADEHILLFNMHHIASDGWSMGLLINEFSTLYTAYVKGEANPLPPLLLQYADYAHWQRDWLQGEALAQQLGYWQQQLAGLPVVHRLPLDRPRPAVQTFSGATVTHQLDAVTTTKLKRLCQSAGATLFMGLHAAFSVLLSRYSNENDIVIGSPIANREQPEIAGLLGFFVNTLVLRSDLSGSPCFNQLLAQSRHLLLDAYAHQQVPFEQLVEQLKPERHLSHGPLFQVMLSLQSEPSPVLNLPDLTLSPVEQTAVVAKVVAKYELVLSVLDHGDVLDISWTYNSDLFAEASIKRMTRHFSQLVRTLVDAPQQSVFAPAMINADEQQQLLVAPNQTAADYPKEQGIAQLFEQQVKQNPQAIALVFDRQQLSYDTLNRQANQLADYLSAQRHIGPETLVGICLERSVDMVVGILAIIKAGGAYVPLDPDHPKIRLNYMLADAGLSTVLTCQKLATQTGLTASQAVCLDDPSLQQQLASCSGDNAVIGASANHLAAVIYTSGSTGQPKGVLLEQRGIVSFVKDTCYITLGADNVMAQVSNMSFDALTFELWGALLNGARLAYIGKNTLLDMAQLAASIKALQIDTLLLTTAFFNLVAQESPMALSGLKTLLFGGEDCSLPAIQAIIQHSAPDNLVHLYGPTENSTVTLFKRLSADYVNNTARNTKKVALGTCRSNNSGYVLDTHLNPVPIGVAGELYIGGDGLARGYLNREALTAQQFIDNPFYDANNPSSSKRLYRSGDLVRRLADGDLVFAGRIDHQVKIRGLRIELGEIEQALVLSDKVNDALVLAKDGANGEKYLAAYVVAAPNSSDNLAVLLRQHLATTLPEYMIPSAFVLLNEMPLTANGKVDRRALPEPDITQQQRLYVAPTTETEKVLCQIWQSLLGIKQVGITDNFFELGGHSLLLNQLLHRINNTLNASLTMKDLFALQTIQQSAARLVLCSPSEQSDLVLLKPGNAELEPLYLVHPVGGQVTCYLSLTSKLTYEGPVYGLQKTTTGFSSIPQMANHYIDLIVEQIGHHPSYLLGWSLGGVIAYEMAQQLRGKSSVLVTEPVNLLMIDSFNPQIVDSSAASQAQLLLLMADELGIDYRSVSAEVLAQPIEPLLALALQLGQSQGVFAEDFTVHELTESFAVLLENRQAFVDYRPTDYTGKVHLLRALNGRNMVDNGWRGLIADLAVVDVDGDHFSLVRGDGAVVAVAGVIDEMIDG